MKYLNLLKQYNNAIVTENAKLRKMYARLVESTAKTGDQPNKDDEVEAPAKTTDEAVKTGVSAEEFFDPDGKANIQSEADISEADEAKGWFESTELTADTTDGVENEEAPTTMTAEAFFKEADETLTDSEIEEALTADEEPAQITDDIDDIPTGPVEAADDKKDTKNTAPAADDTADDKTPAPAADDTEDDTADDSTDDDTDDVDEDIDVEAIANEAAGIDEAVSDDDSTVGDEK